MYIKITSLDGRHLIVNLASVGSCFEDDNVIYFAGVPCLLSSAEPLKQDEEEGTGWDPDF